MTPTKTALRLMVRGFDPEFVVAYMEEELRRDPLAFHTDMQRTFADFNRQITDAWSGIRNAFVPALQQVRDMLDSMDFSNPDYVKGA